ncbi:Methionine sulfoxide reductase A [Bifidobacterium dentium Bd1]|uniref:Methionine sulfoxide reductase A n=1 Tax=Bifidobacterium dentium (strain ATCC 27534 / DSM 20436 / JCM 1195 / Bd1) TaxID=401473 RepID=D2Q5V9_BIFDB|nr:Methionine sulfoxide reductase A [Bifidobacterium dentium Bd1]
MKNGDVIRDVPFGSPSAAAGFVLGSSCNGWEKWRTSDGKTLKEARA